MRQTSLEEFSYVARHLSHAGDPASEIAFKIKDKYDVTKGTHREKIFE